jgi:regulator of nucleoside diphosphate kinase
MIINENDYSRITNAIKQLRLSAIMNINIKTLANELKEAAVIPTKNTPENLVTMNSKVKIKRLDNEQEMEVAVVYHEDADIKMKRISVFAPLGFALLGTKEHQTFNCTIPSGTAYYKVCKVLYQPEAAGDFHL